MATTKTLTPTNQAITLAAFTEKPDNRTNVTNDDKLADAVNALNSKLTPTLILEQTPTTSGENAYSCNWAVYRVLIIAIGNYGNIYSTTVVPASEFDATASGHAVIISYGGGSAWGIYKNGESGVKIIAPSSIQSYTRIRIWGVL